ncbi:uncharacterized protein LOC110914576 [Helianthus annuus]|uniref:uncharacterized protein LOC110914576 n=1 Tax=Helianthus annuus TaxID=4232 RepID=UPI000B90296F|nr:uncharacterized protein LOC110914576 [Helianthus annuus]
MEPETLWVKVITSIHASNRKVELIPFKKSMSGVWKNIGEIVKDFTKNNININTNLRSIVGLGDKTLFWIDTWLGNEPLKVQFPNLYLLAVKKKSLVLENYKILNGGRMWDWVWLRAPTSEAEKQEMDNLMGRLQISEHQEFSVKNVKSSLGQRLDLNSAAYVFSWNNWVTGKCTTFVWRAIEEKIASAVALRNRGMNLPDIICKTCGAAEESAVHIPLRCNFAKRTWESVTNWLKIPMVNVEGSLKDLLLEMNEIQRSKGVRKAIYAVAIQTMWILWKTRNERVFKGRQGKVQTVLEEIKEASYPGVKLRSKHGSITRQEWWDFNI